MASPKSDPDGDDRRPSAEALEQRVAEAAEGELLDERHQACRPRPVRRVRGRMAGSQCFGRQALLVAGMEERGRTSLEDVDRRARTSAETRAAARPRARRPERQQLGAEPAIASTSRSRISVLDDRRRRAVEYL